MLEEENDDAFEGEDEEVVEEDEFILEGRRWAEGGYAYGFDFASTSSKFFRQKSRKNLRQDTKSQSKDSIGSSK